MNPPLLLLSGLLCDSTIWSDIPERLADAADVSVLSFRGFDSIRAMSEHVQSLAPERFALAGHSMGGRVALEVLRAVPDRVMGLALLNTGVHAVREGEWQARRLLLMLAQQRGMAALAAEWLPPMMANNPLRNAELLPRLAAMVERCSVADYAA